MGFAALLPFIGKAVNFIKGNKELIGGVAQGVLDERNKGADRAEQQRQFNERKAEDARQFDATQKANYGRTALEAIQLDPLTQQKSRQKQALLEQLLKGFSMPNFDAATGTSSGGFQFDPSKFAAIASFFSPDARGAAEQQFATTAGTATNGQYAMPPLQSLGYPALGAALGGAPTPPPPPAPRRPRIGIPNRFATERTGRTEF